MKKQHQQLLALGIGYLLWRTLRSQSVAQQQHQQEIQMAQENEWGFPVCEYPNGQLTHGRVTHGTPTSVQIDTGSCPTGTKFMGMAHSHPGGVAYPSDIDVNAMRRSGASKMCIVVPERDELACYTLKRPR